MNRSFKAISFSATLFFAMAALSACDTEVDLGARPQFWNGSNNLTLLVFDGQTGAGVADAKVTIQIGPTVLTATRTDNVYVIPQIPNGTFPVFIQSAGYLPYVATQNFSGNTNIASATATLSYFTYTAVLFPVRGVDRDITIRAFDGENGEPVASAQVVAQIDVSRAIQSLVPPGSSPLPGALGYLPRMIVANMTNGVAVFPKDQLVFGALYDISVIAARNSASEYLEAKVIQDLKAGDHLPTLVLFMGPPAQTPVALKTNNEDGGTQPNLVVTFPYAIEVCSDVDSHDWRNVTPLPIDTDDDRSFAAPDPQSPVTVTRSESDTVLTLSYKVDPAPPTLDDPDDNLAVEFTGLKVRVVGGSTCTDLGSVKVRGDAAVATTIVVRKGKK